MCKNPDTWLINRNFAYGFMAMPSENWLPMQTKKKKLGHGKEFVSR